MAKFTWKEAEDDPIFKQGWVLSSPNLSKPRPTSTERAEGADTKGTDDSINLEQNQRREQ